MFIPDMETTHNASVIQWVMGALCSEIRWLKLELTTHIHTVSRLETHGPSPITPLHTECVLLRHRVNFLPLPDTYEVVRLISPKYFQFLCRAEWLR